MAISFNNTPQNAVNLYAQISDANSAAYDYTVTRRMVILDTWAQVIGASGAGANTVQLQTAGGAANITGVTTFNNQPNGTILRNTALPDVNSVLAAGSILRYNVVRAVAPNGIAVNIVCVPGN